MRLDIITLHVQVSVAALADLECSKVVFFADGVFAGATRHLPPEAAVTVLAQPTGTCLLLQIQAVLLQVCQDVDVFPKHVLIEPVIFELANVVHWPQLVGEVWVLVLLYARKRCGTNLICTSTAQASAKDCNASAAREDGLQTTPVHVELGWLAVDRRCQETVEITIL
jgi:hypothetical protein